MAMSRDGLLPKIFSSIHPKFRTPWFSTILTGFMVAIPALFMNLSEVTDLSVIGTLFAFTIVCAGVLVKDKEFAGEKRFVPYISSRYLGPVILIGAFVLANYLNPDFFKDLFDMTATADRTSLQVFTEKIPYLVFLPFTVFMILACIWKRLSLIPVLGVMCCTYLMTSLGWTNWFRFFIWMIIGFVLYFAYGFWNSKLNVNSETAAST
jgi:amino acid transporter